MMKGVSQGCRDVVAFTLAKHFRQEKNLPESASFRPFSRMIFSANEIPKSPDRSYAYYRRWCIVPFPNIFRPGENEDKKILQWITQEEELSGLLNFSVNGLKRLHHQQRFTEPEPVKKALDDYMKFNDTVEAFIQECCRNVAK